MKVRISDEVMPQDGLDIHPEQDGRRHATG